jgi:hypothetical protein
VCREESTVVTTFAWKSVLSMRTCLVSQSVTAMIDRRLHSYMYFLITSQHRRHAIQGSISTTGIGSYLCLQANPPPHARKAWACIWTAAGFVPAAKSLGLAMHAYTIVAQCTPAQLNMPKSSLPSSTSTSPVLDLTYTYSIRKFPPQSLVREEATT